MARKHGLGQVRDLAMASAKLAARGFGARIYKAGSNSAHICSAIASGQPQAAVPAVPAALPMISAKCFQHV
jgi:hypothetical protein